MNVDDLLPKLPIGPPVDPVTHAMLKRLSDEARHIVDATDLMLDGSLFTLETAEMLYIDARRYVDLYEAERPGRVAALREEAARDEAARLADEQDDEPD